MSIFSSLQTYAGQWSAKSSRAISKEERAEVQSAEVVSSDYGLSMVFTLKGGKGKKYIPVSRDSQLAEGDEVSIASITLIELEREGDNNIFRADGDAK